MVRTNATLSQYLVDPGNKARFLEIMGRWEFRVVMKGYIRNLDDSNYDTSSIVDWWMDRLSEAAPDIFTVFVSEENSRRWVGGVLMDLVNIYKENIL